MAKAARPRASNLQRILWSIIAIVLCGLIGIFIGYRRLLEERDVFIEGVKDAAIISVEKILQTATRDGIKEWDLEAVSGRYLAGVNQAELEQLQVTFYLANGSTVSLTADAGILHTDTKNMRVEGNVVVISGDYRLTTQSLHYDFDKRQLYTHDAVVITGQKVNLTGDSLVVELDQHRARLAGNVKSMLLASIDLARR
jgi:LPS export ABC transporter protein LptC